MLSFPGKFTQRGLRNLVDARRLRTWHPQLTLNLILLTLSPWKIVSNKLPLEALKSLFRNGDRWEDIAKEAQENVGKKLQTPETNLFVACNKKVVTILYWKML